jgi:serine/threonine-protein kinase
MAINPVPFGKYELISRLAAGGMAEIFLARTKSIQGFEKYLVIKKILRNRTSDPEFVRMFLDEARVAATLDHPNIVQIYDVGHVESEYFIAMEYLRGHNLIEIVRAGAKLGYSKPPLEHVMSILTGVCAGLHYAHDKRDFQGRPLEIVHRDVTPQNIVVSFDGAVKIVDFGIAKAATREVETLAGTLKGKIGYMSPEQCRGQPVDRRSDLFAVGIILYELTTGKRLYHERSDFETLKKIIEGPVPSPRDILPFYPAALNAIVVRCLQKDPNDRYQSARDLHADLDAFARDNQLVTGTVPLAQYMERVFADELAAQKGDGAGLAFASQMATASSQPSYLGETSRRSSKIDVPLEAARRAHLMTRALQAVAAVLLVMAGGLFVWWRTRPPEGMLPPQPIAVAPTQPGAAPGQVPGQPGTVAGAQPAPGQPIGALPPGASPAAVPGVQPVPGAQPVTPLPVGAVPGTAPGQVAAVPGQPLAPVGPAHSKPAAKPGDAHLTVASDPRCEVLVDGVPYGATPLIDLAVPAGKHTIILLNSQQGIKEVQKVQLQTGQLWTRSFQWEGGKMNMQNGLSAKMLATHEEKPKEAPPAVAATDPTKTGAAPATHPKPVEGAAAQSPAPAPAVAAAAPKPTPAPAPPPATKPTPPPAAPPKPAAPPARMVAGFVLDAQKLSGTQPRLPQWVVERNENGKKLVGTYKICVDKDGHVYDVTTVASIAGADGSIMDTFKTWKYKPQTSNVCGTKVLTFQAGH